MRPADTKRRSVTFPLYASSQDIDATDTNTTSALRRGGMVRSYTETGDSGSAVLAAIVPRLRVVAAALTAPLPMIRTALDPLEADAVVVRVAVRARPDADDVAGLQ